MKLLKSSLANKASFYYEETLQLYLRNQYENAIAVINKAMKLNSIKTDFYFVKSDLLIQIADFKTSVSNINKLINLNQHSESKDDIIDLKANLTNKLAFYYYIQGQIYYDAKFYLEAFDSFTKASEIMSNNLTYKIRRYFLYKNLN